MLLFLAVSLASWNHQVTTIEMNRNDASCYLILARNLVWNGTYSLDQVAPFRPHTEWPPGVPLLYVPPMLFVRDFPLSHGQALLVHAWTLLLAVGSLWLLWRYLREITSQATALLVVALTAATKAFLDSANASTADALAVGIAFGALREVDHYFRVLEPKRARIIRVHVVLALIPLIKPYLGMVFVVYLWKIWSRRRSWNEFGKGCLKLGACCTPFAMFLIYSVVAARATGDISAITWLTTDNATAVQAGVAAADHKSLGEWIAGGLRTVRYYLVYHIADSGVPLLHWMDFRTWPMLLRVLVLFPILGTMGLGIGRLILKRQFACVIYGAAMLAFFVIFACDSPRYFTVLTPVCALAWLEGIDVLIGVRSCHEFTWSESRRWSRGIVGVTALSAAVWMTHRLAHSVDPAPFYREVYAVLRMARDLKEQEILVVPYQLRSVATVESGKRVLTYEEFRNMTETNTGAARVCVKFDPDDRIAPQEPSATRVAFRGQFVNLELGAVR